MSEHLAKPFTQAELIAVVTRAAAQASRRSCDVRRRSIADSMARTGRRHGPGCRPAGCSIACRLRIEALLRTLEEPTCACLAGRHSPRWRMNWREARARSALPGCQRSPPAFRRGSAPIAGGAGRHGRRDAARGRGCAWRNLRRRRSLGGTDCRLEVGYFSGGRCSAPGGPRTIQSARRYSGGGSCRRFQTNATGSIAAAAEPWRDRKAPADRQ